MPSTCFLNSDYVALRREQITRLLTAAATVLKTELPDVEDLWYAEERRDVANWLRHHGWDASGVNLKEMLDRCGRSIPDEDVMPPTDFVSAQRMD